ncbi:hypothetical protein THASP1DRAFT_20671 [Thamnocephalis sphaerospora]|uniref:DUF726-domain-containing protein n=1 Tax=Thamnocephalis sphaerospora TaxID=78915 RepID=A0A4P9XHN5_9FUNG|nr:hypothetical protein THASP1DRAFT_20671 [Thamnocephalis sphaerospora]|eukprot:RKP04801.1 hypothetical protein THASP1DRAFT_20671 [Thamnocephalis sphaerospora]
MLCPGEYDARSRVVLQHVARRIGMPSDRLRGLERLIAQRLYFARAAAMESAEDEETGVSDASGEDDSGHLRNKRGRLRRWATTGTSVVVGALALGLTGGLAAPMLIVGMGALGATWAATLATAGGLALVTSLFGVAGGGLTGHRMARRTGGLAEFAFVPIGVDPHLPIIPSLHATIVVPGYLHPKMSADTPWYTAYNNHLKDHDVYALAFDTAVLHELDEAFRKFVAVEAADYLIDQLLSQTVLNAVLAPLSAPMTLMKLGSIIDNPWGMAMNRARKAGHALADILQDRVQGRRPISLIGYSVGALVIFKCLQELAKRRCYGLVDSGKSALVLLGAPVRVDSQRWSDVRSVVSGRLVNGYIKSDWVLAFLYRVHERKLKPAGLQPISTPGVESVDLSDIVQGHLCYRKQLDAILHAINIS